MISATKRHDELSRRSLLTGGLAAGFVLAFHLPLRAAINEPVQPLDVTDGKFAPNAFIRIDETGKTYPAKVQRIGARVDPVSQSIKLTAAIDGRFPDLIAGMSGRVALSAPTAAAAGQ